MSVYTKHLKIILKGLKYQSLDKLIGRDIAIYSIESVESDILSALTKDIKVD